jgi:hypothetical protein
MYLQLLKSTVSSVTAYASLQAELIASDRPEANRGYEGLHRFYQIK